MYNIDLKYVQSSTYKVLCAPWQVYSSSSNSDCVCKVVIFIKTELTSNNYIIVILLEIKLMESELLKTKVENAKCLD